MKQQKHRFSDKHSIQMQEKFRRYSSEGIENITLRTYEVRYLMAVTII
jgi:hypothetical protein